MDEQTNPMPTAPNLNNGVTPPVSQPGMDIRPPENVVAAPAPQQPPVQQFTPLTSPAPMPVETPIPAPVQEAVSQPSPTTLQTEQPAPNISQAQTTHVKSNKGNLIKVILIIVIALLLIATAGYFYLKNKNHKTAVVAQPSTVATTQSQATTPTTTAPSVTQDLSQTTQSVGANLSKADNSNDLGAGDLTTATLGL